MGSQWEASAASKECAGLGRLEFFPSGLIHATLNPRHFQICKRLLKAATGPNGRCSVYWAATSGIHCWTGILPSHPLSFTLSPVCSGAPHAALPGVK